MKIGIVGATGAVGQQMLMCLVERDLKIEELRLFASERSAGKEVDFKGNKIIVENLETKRFAGLDYVLGALEADISKEIAQEIVDAGCIYVDNSSAFRSDMNVPLVVPEVNREDIFKHKGIIANPNCSTIITLMVASVLNRLSKIDKMMVSTYQAVSGAGVMGMQELNQQIQSIGHGQACKVNTFQKQIAFNCIPQIGDINDLGYTSEEMKMQNEGRKILHNDDLLVNCTCVRVPVMRSHSISCTCFTQDKVELEKFKQALAKAKGIQIVELPTPLDASNQDEILVGRIRNDILFENGITFWCVGDQIRKGAATNAVQIIEELEKGLRN
ncbi:MAG: aspartate-semialdehyde dehydrogenase [Anaerorhabdus sp.]|uniref:aspartate-semialdehyde dehydrogenase n=1 Tax=Anaerorhabdus sp. TaxID=1872524 RepID=UPI002FC70D48